MPLSGARSPDVQTFTSGVRSHPMVRDLTLVFPFLAVTAVVAHRASLEMLRPVVPVDYMVRVDLAVVQQLME